MLHHFWLTAMHFVNQIMIFLDKYYNLRLGLTFGNARMLKLHIPFLSSNDFLKSEGKSLTNN